MHVPGFVGVIVAAAATILVALVFGGRLIRGENGYSLSKLQLFVWTLVVAISYLLYLGKLVLHGQALSIEVSSNLLLLLGFSAGSYVTAGGIRNYQDQRGLLAAPPSSAQLRWRTLISDTAGNPDLSKIQLLVWTIVALAAYFAAVVLDLHSAKELHRLPDVSDMLVALMGVSQAAYLGKKAVSVQNPLPLTAPVKPGAAAPGAPPATPTAVSAGASSGTGTP